MDGKRRIIKAFVFDMDGLLVETESIHMRAFAEFLRRNGVSPPPGYTASLVGLSIADNIETIKRDFGVRGESAALARERNALYLEILEASRIEPLPGVAEMFEYASTHGLKRAVCSSSERAQLNVVLPRLVNALKEATKPEEFFDVIVSGDGIGNLKPAPDIYLACAKALGLAPAECVAFEDSPFGVEAAVGAGMHAVAVPSPFTKNAKAWRTPCVVDTLLDVLEDGIVRTDSAGKVYFAGG
jgi:HAD superfamily hydrolase (TIGR01509 family)